MQTFLVFLICIIFLLSAICIGYWSLRIVVLLVKATVIKMVKPESLKKEKKNDSNKIKTR